MRPTRRGLNRLELEAMFAVLVDEFGLSEKCCWEWTGGRLVSICLDSVFEIWSCHCVRI